MSNLGAYQWITTASKKVGGPINLLLLTGAAGAAVYKCGELAVKQCVKAVKTHKAKNTANAAGDKLYNVSEPGKSNEGLTFIAGDQFRVLEADGDSVLIEKINDENNPYYVSAKLLRDISDYTG